jgi:SAM-dependent methyltransferase
VPERARLLDVGIGTGGALLANADLVRTKHLRIHGIDVDAAYVRRCRERIERAGLQSQIHVAVEPFTEHLGGPYEAVYFSGSFMLLPDPVAAVRHARRLLADDGLVYFTQTFEHRRSMVAHVKPWLRLLTTIDFGRATYEDDFRVALREGGAELIEMVTLKEGASRSARLAIARAAAEGRPPRTRSRLPSGVSRGAGPRAD